MSRLSTSGKITNGVNGRGRCRESPLPFFQRWLDEAIAHDVPEPGDDAGHRRCRRSPSTRVVLLKDCDERGLVWHTNYQSRKGRELAEHPFAALRSSIGSRWNAWCASKGA